MKVLDFYTVVNLQCTWILCIHVTYVIFLHTILPFRHLRKRLAPTLHKSTTPFFPDSELAWEDDEVDRNTRETPLTRIYHTDIARSRFRIAYRDAREGGRECRATQVRATWSDFLLISPFSPADRSEFANSASRPRRRRNDGDGDAHEFGHGKRERFSRFTTARGLLVHRESPFSPGTRVESRESGPMRDVDGSSWFEGRRGTVSDCERARPVHRTPYSVARIRKYVSTQLRATSPPLSLDFKLALSRFYHWDALILRSFSLRNGAYHLAEDYLDPTSSSHRQWKEMKGNPFTESFNATFVDVKNIISLTSCN